MEGWCIFERTVISKRKEEVCCYFMYLVFRIFMAFYYWLRKQMARKTCLKVPSPIFYFKL
jgi:hypothetical protein